MLWPHLRYAVCSKLETHRIGVEVSRKRWLFDYIIYWPVAFCMGVHPAHPRHRNLIDWCYIGCWIINHSIWAYFAWVYLYEFDAIGLRPWLYYEEWIKALPAVVHGLAIGLYALYNQEYKRCNNDPIHRYRKGELFPALWSIFTAAQAVAAWEFHVIAHDHVVLITTTVCTAESWGIFALVRGRRAIERRSRERREQQGC